jgi:hypothetical protein
MFARISNGIARLYSHRLLFVLFGGAFFFGYSIFSQGNSG